MDILGCQNTACTKLAAIGRREPGMSKLTSAMIPGLVISDQYLDLW